MDQFQNPLREPFVLLHVTQGRQGLGTEPTHSHRTAIDLLAASLRKSMPELYPDELMNRSQILLSKQECFLPELLRTTIYHLSNNIELPGLLWDETIEFLHQCGLPSLQLKLRSINDKTMLGFADTLFQRLFRGGSFWRRNDVLALDTLKWLLSCGYDPNTRIQYFPGYGIRSGTPIQAAAAWRSLGFTQALLDAGAKVDLLLGQETRSPLELAIPSPNDTDVSIASSAKQIIWLLLRHGASAYLDEGLHYAITLPDSQLAAEFVNRGANLRAEVSSEPPGPFITVARRTALCVAAAQGRDQTKVVLGLLKSRHPFALVASVVTTDVLIAAASTGDQGLFYSLFQLNPNAVLPSAEGLEVLKEVVSKGWLDTTRLLLNMRGSYNCDEKETSLLHMASYHGHEHIMRFLIEGGANVNAVSATYLYHRPSCYYKDRYDDCPALVTPLQLVIHYGFKRSCIDLLLRSGARVTCEELIPAVEALDVEMVKAVLAAGGDANSHSSKYPWMSVLDIALLKTHDCCTRDPNHRERRDGFPVIMLLFEYGARLVGDEVALAARRGNADLLNILLRKGGSMTDADEDGVTAIEQAIVSLKYNEIQDLIQQHLASYNSGVLCAAVLKGMSSLVQQLVLLRDKHAPTDILESTAIGIAANMGNMQVLQELLKYLPLGDLAILPSMLDPVHSECYSFKIDPESYNFFWRDEDILMGSPLTLAALGGPRSASAMEELIRNECEPDMLTWAVSSFRPKNSVLVTLLLEHQKRLDNCITPPDLPFHNPLLGPINRHDNELVRSLLDAGAEVNFHMDASKHDITPLVCADMWEDHYAFVRLESRFEGLEDDLGLIEFYGSPLKVAIESENLDITQCLLQAGAKADQHDLELTFGHSPLQLAAISGNLDIFEHILEAGPKVNCPDGFWRGVTALQLAAQHGHLGLVKQLLDLGVDANATVGPGVKNTALGGAAKHGRIDILELLLHHGTWTTERGWRQYIQAVALATFHGRTGARRLLRDRHEWTDEDESQLARELGGIKNEDESCN